MNASPHYWPGAAEGLAFLTCLAGLHRATLRRYTHKRTSDVVQAMWCPRCKAASLIVELPRIGGTRQFQTAELDLSVWELVRGAKV